MAVFLAAGSPCCSLGLGDRLTPKIAADDAEWTGDRHAAELVDETAFFGSQLN